MIWWSVYVWQTYIHMYDEHMQRTIIVWYPIINCADKKDYCHWTALKAQCDTADLTAATTSQTHWPSLRVVVIGLLKATAAHIIGHAAQLARLQYCWYCTSCGAGVLPIALFAMASDCWSHSGAFSVALHRLCCRGHAVKYCWCCKNIIFSRLCM